MGFGKNQSLLTSAPTILRHVLSPYLFKIASALLAVSPEGFESLTAWANAFAAGLSVLSRPSANVTPASPASALKFTSFNSGFMILADFAIGVDATAERNSFFFSLPF